MRYQLSRRQLSVAVPSLLLVGLTAYICKIQLDSRSVGRHRFGSHEEGLFLTFNFKNVIQLGPQESDELKSVPTTIEEAILIQEASGSLGPDDIVLILKTGSSTPSDRLRAQLATFASAKYKRSPANTIIISDAAEKIDVDGMVWDVVDVLQDLVNMTSIAASEKIKIYHTQSDRVRAGESIQTKDPPGSNNQGWTLDALKFLPGYTRAAQMFPNAKWFIGLDDDNYLFWDSLTQFLALQDHTKKLYMGSPSWMVANNVKFIHGGSVTISSQAAVKARFVDHVAGLDQFHQAATELCCGDGVLAMAYADLKIMPDDLYRDFFNGESIEKTRVTQHQFCKPLLGLHHLSGHDILDMERHWSLKQTESVLDHHSITTWGSYLTIMTRPLTNETGEKEAWDFVGVEDNRDKVAVAWGDQKSAAICKATCEQNGETCLSWTFLADTEECWLSPMAIVGQSGDSRVSGVNLIRVHELELACVEEDWRKEVLRKAAMRNGVAA